MKLRKLLATCFLLPSLSMASNINVIVSANVIPMTLERHVLTTVSTHHFVQINNFDTVGRDFDILYYHCFANMCWYKEREIRVKAREDFVEDFYYPENIKLEKSGQYAVMTFTKVIGKAIPHYIKVDKGFLSVK